MSWETGMHGSQGAEGQQWPSATRLQILQPQYLFSDPIFENLSALFAIMRIAERFQEITFDLCIPMLQ